MGVTQPPPSQFFANVRDFLCVKLISEILANSLFIVFIVVQQETLIISLLPLPHWNEHLFWAAMCLATSHLHLAVK